MQEHCIDAAHNDCMLIEETRRELAREVQRRKKDDTGSRGDKTEKLADNKKIVQQGFTLFSVVFCAFIAFMMGIYIRMGKEKKI